MRRRDASRYPLWRIVFKPNECVTGHEEQDAGMSDSMNPPPSSASASPSSATHPLVSASSSSSRPPRMDENAPSSSAGLTGTNTTQLPRTSQQEDCMSQNDIPKTSVFGPFGEPSVSPNLIEGDQAHSPPTRDPHRPGDVESRSIFNRIVARNQDKNPLGEVATEED